MTCLPRPVVRAIVVWRLPRVANVEVTTACDLACPLCPTHVVTRGTRYLSGHHVAGILNGNDGLRDVCFHVQGEPLLHPRLFEFVDRFAARGVCTHFSTNGNRLLQRASELMNSRLDSIAVAIDGSSQGEYERYRVGGSVERVKGGVRAIMAAREDLDRATPRVELQVIEFPHLGERMGEIRAEFEELGADQVRIKKPTLEVSEEQFASRAGEPRIKRGLKRARNFLDSLPAVPANAERRARRYRDDPICSQLEKATVLADGRVVACCMDADGETAFGNVEKKTLAQVWRSQEHVDLLARYQSRELSLCGLCTLTHPT